MPSEACRPADAPPRIRVLFGCAGWPSGVIDVGSWAARRGLAEVVVHQIHAGPSDGHPPECLAALDRLEVRTGRRSELLRHDRTLTPAAEQALAAVGPRFATKLIDFRPHVVGFRVEGGDFERVQGLVAAVRLLSDAEIVLGGPTATSHPREVLENLRADYVFAGEAEETFAQFLELARQRDSRDRAAEIAGLAFRYGGRTCHNTLPQDGYGRTAMEAGGADCRVPLRCLRNLVRPVASADVLEANRLDWSLLAGFEGQFDSLFFTGGRGCPGACTFCAKLHGQEVRVKSARQLLEEIEAADDCVARGRLRVSRWPLFEHADDPALAPLEVAWAAVYDEDFFLHRKRAVEFLGLWDQSPLKTRYRLSFQTNPCTLLTASGEFHSELLGWIGRLKPMIQLGAESFNPELLARWRKRHNAGQLDRVLDALEATRQDYTVFILLSDFDTTPEELVETLRLLVLAALRRPGMRIASSPFTIPLFDSETRLRLEHRGLLGQERVRHFTDYERPQPGWMDPLAAELADLADAELRFALEPRHRDAAVVQAMEVVLARIREEQGGAVSRSGWPRVSPHRLGRLLAQAQRAMDETRESRFRAVAMQPSR